MKYINNQCKICDYIQSFKFCWKHQEILKIVNDPILLLNNCKLFLFIILSLDEWIKLCQNFFIKFWIVEVNQTLIGNKQEKKNCKRKEGREKLDGWRNTSFARGTDLS